MSQTPRVLIAGAGVGGLSLAQGLAKHGIRVTVFEKDASSGFRAQGYRFRMNPNGSAALQSVLPEALFAQFEQSAATTRFGGTRMKHDGTVLHYAEGPGAIAAMMGRAPGGGTPWPERPRGPDASGESGRGRQGGQFGVYTVDRTLFRALLLQNIDVRFGKQVKGYTLDSPSSGKVTLHFIDGSSETGDFLVGADGLWSAVRRQFLPQHLPVDTTGRTIYGKTPVTAEFLEKFPKELHQWMSMTIDDSGEKVISLLTEPIRFADEAKSVAAKVLPQPSEDYIYWVLAGSPDAFELPDSQFLRLTPEQTVAHSLKITEKWSPAIRSVFESQSIDQASTLRISSVIPKLPQWQPSSLVTLLGDAVHVMSPTGGVGANTALRDSAALCEVLRKAFGENGGKISEEDVGRYEADMRVYAGEAVEASQHGGAKIYGQPPFEECKPVDWL